MYYSSSSQLFLSVSLSRLWILAVVLIRWTVSSKSTSFEMGTYTLWLFRSIVFCFFSVAYIYKSVKHDTRHQSNGSLYINTTLPIGIYIHYILMCSEDQSCEKFITPKKSFGGKEVREKKPFYRSLSFLFLFHRCRYHYLYTRDDYPVDDNECLINEQYR